MLKIYAIVETGGKQYRVQSGQVVDVDLMDVPDGDTIELDRVLLIGDEDKLTIGTPLVEGAKVMATSQGNGRNKKIIVMKYKNKVRYRKKTGHRQHYTRLSIGRIIEPGAKASSKKAAQTESEVTENGS